MCLIICLSEKQTLCLERKGFVRGVFECVIFLFGVFNCGLGVNDSSGILWRLQILGVEVYYFVGF